jgi:hypothetical protein
VSDFCQQARKALAEKSANSRVVNTLDLTENDANHKPSATVDLTKDDTSMTSSPTTGTKRKSAPASDEDDIDLDEIEIPPGATLDSADVVRNKINRFIESGEMKVKDFVATLGVSGTGYHRFMHQHGPSKGMQSDCYIEAWKFFEKRKVAGLKMPTKKKAKTDNASNSPASAKKSAKSKDDASQT